MDLVGHTTIGTFLVKSLAEWNKLLQDQTSKLIKPHSYHPACTQFIGASKIWIIPWGNPDFLSFKMTTSITLPYAPNNPRTCQHKTGLTNKTNCH